MSSQGKEKVTLKGSKKRPEFMFDLVGFVSYSNMTEVNFIVPPEHDVKAVVSCHIHKDGSRLITLVFRPTKPELGRRGYSLKQEWEQLPTKPKIPNCLVCESKIEQKAYNYFVCSNPECKKEYDAEDLGLQKEDFP